MASKKVTKSDLVQKVFEKTNLTKKEIQSVTDELINQIKKSLEEKSTIEIRGVGTFEVSFRNGRKNARNPKSGKIVDVAPHYVAKFIPGKEIKDSLKNTKEDNTNESVAD